MTEEEYQKAIPTWCRYPTVEIHKEALMLCWGITGGYVQEEGIDYCDSCELFDPIYT